MTVASQSLLQGDHQPTPIEAEELRLAVAEALRKDQTPVSVVHLLALIPEAAVPVDFGEEGVAGVDQKLGSMMMTYSLLPWRRVASIHLHKREIPVQRNKEQNLCGLKN